MLIVQTYASLTTHNLGLKDDEWNVLEFAMQTAWFSNYESIGAGMLYKFRHPWKNWCTYSEAHNFQAIIGAEQKRITN